MGAHLCCLKLSLCLAFYIFTLHVTCTRLNFSLPRHSASGPCFEPSYSVSKLQRCHTRYIMPDHEMPSDDELQRRVSELVAETETG